MTRMNPIWIAILYCAVSFVILFTTLGVHKYFIFSGIYIWAAIVVPTFLIPGLIIYWRIRFNQLHWLYGVVGCLMVVGISFLHMLFVVTASATV
ncbi:hypothetical protein SAMN04488515_3422 [Cognatiyoonia koreensis]|uniref:Uncharacterized protein n=1 Tax=Cognatiyoonia koreensis TaxID=364200 RepID=A0A1I0RWS2_9RHOB|nr:hypothetical protein [Cognatiyoonia koreensis]SEW45993.1 hypothetical protein SAMN04488515_3422 [Cognatiyoonia koreensis]